MSRGWSSKTPLSLGRPEPQHSTGYRPSRFSRLSHSQCLGKQPPQTNKPTPVKLHRRTNMPGCHGLRCHTHAKREHAFICGVSSLVRFLPCRSSTWPRQRGPWQPFRLPVFLMLRLRSHSNATLLPKGVFLNQCPLIAGSHGLPTWYRL